MCYIHSFIVSGAGRVASNWYRVLGLDFYCQPSNGSCSWEFVKTIITSLDGAKYYKIWNQLASTQGVNGQWPTERPTALPLRYVTLGNQYGYVGGRKFRKTMTFQVLCVARSNCARRWRLHSDRRAVQSTYRLLPRTCVLYSLPSNTATFPLTSRDPALISL